MEEEDNETILTLLLPGMDQIIQNLWISKNDTNTTILDSSSFEPLDWSWDRIGFTLILGAIILGTITGNTLVLYTFVTRSRELRSPSHFFIANLALADLLVAVLCLPFTATWQITGRWYFGSKGCLLWTIAHLWFCSSSILSICAVCFERWISVKFPLDCKKILARPRLIRMIIAVWVISGILTLTAVFAWPEESPLKSNDEQLKCKVNNQIGHVLLIVLGMLYFPLTLMIILYCSIYTIATKHLNRMKKKAGIAQMGISFTKSQKRRFEEGNNLTEDFPTDDRNSFMSVTFDTDVTRLEEEENSNSNSNSNNQETLKKKNGERRKDEMGKRTLILNDNKSNKQINLAKRLFILVGIVMICYFPYYTIFLVRAFNPESISEKYYNFFKWLRYFNSFINPYIYALAMPAYSLAIRNTLTKLRSKFLPFS